MTEVIKSVQIQTGDMFVVSIPIDMEGNDTAMGKWRVLHYDYFGRCYSLILSKVMCYDNLFWILIDNKLIPIWLRMSQSLRNMTIHYVQLEALMDTYVYIHYPGQVREKI